MTTQVLILPLLYKELESEIEMEFIAYVNWISLSLPKSLLHIKSTFMLHDYGKKL